MCEYGAGMQCRSTSRGSWRSAETDNNGGFDKSSDSTQSTPRTKIMSSSKKFSPPQSRMNQRLHISENSSHQGSGSGSSNYSGPSSCRSSTSSSDNLEFSGSSRSSHFFCWDFQVEVLSCMRHPNMVLLVGACPEYGCLVYEYMENGSLEDRLFIRSNTPPLSWATRFKIASEIATALLFLHQTKPEPLVHRDLKPANILLGRNYVSKISDVGLARLVPASVADNVTQYHMTAAAGTFCYIDPEYQQTGMQVARSIEKGTFAEMLDPAVEDWPVEEALLFAKMALNCCELRKKDRPDLGSMVLPELNRLRDLGFEHEGGLQD